MIEVIEQEPTYEPRDYCWFVEVVWKQWGRNDTTHYVRTRAKLDKLLSWYQKEYGKRTDDDEISQIIVSKPKAEEPDYAL